MDETKEKKESLHKLTVAVGRTIEHCEGMREWFHTHANTHMYICTHTHTLGYCDCSGQFREKQQWVFPPWSGHIGLRVIVCVLSTLKIRRKVGPNVWLWGLYAEWPRSTGDSIMALAWENTTIVLETLMALVGSV